MTPVLYPPQGRMRKIAIVPAIGSLYAVTSRSCGKRLGYVYTADEPPEHRQQVRRRHAGTQWLLPAWIAELLQAGLWNLVGDTIIWDDFRRSGLAVADVAEAMTSTLAAVNRGDIVDVVDYTDDEITLVRRGRRRMPNYPGRGDAEVLHRVRKVQKHTKFQWDRLHVGMTAVYRPEYSCSHLSSSFAKWARSRGQTGAKIECCPLKHADGRLVGVSVERLQ